MVLVQQLIRGVQADVRNYYQESEIGLQLSTLFDRVDTLLSILQSFENSSYAYPYLIFLSVSVTICIVIAFVVFFLWFFKWLRTKKGSLPISSASTPPLDLSSVSSPIELSSSQLSASAAINRMRVANLT